MKRTLATLRFIRKQRRQKKKKLYRLALGVALDKTISIYLGLFSVLFFFIVYDQLQQFEALFQQYESVIEHALPWLAIALVARVFIRSNYDPGIEITSTEYKLSSLPYFIEQIWNILFVEKIIRMVVSLSIVFGLVYLLTPFSLPALLKIYLIIVVTSILLMIPHWFLHSMNGIKRWIVYISAILMVALLRLLVANQVIDDLLVVSLILFVLLLLTIILYSSRFKRVAWSRIAEVNDHKVWNMAFIQYMSKTKTKPMHRKSIIKDIYNHKKRRKAFPYDRPERVYRRIWFKALQENMQYSLMILLYFAICVILTSLQGQIAQALGLIAAIFMYVKMIGSLFYTVFQYPLIHSIPWKTKEIIKGYRFYIHISLIALIITLLFAFLISKGFSLVLVGYTVCFIGAIYLLCDLQLTLKIKGMNNRWYVASIFDQLLTLSLYVSLFVSVTNERLLLLVLLIVIIGNLKKNFPKFN